MSAAIRHALPLLLSLALLGGALPVVRAQGADEIVVQAREALRRKDRKALAAATQAVNAAGHPLAMWVEYWELQNRLFEAQQPELDAFAARWPGTYVEDRLRNDWLLELGRRRDWADFRAEFPRFRMNDDREVTCYALLTQTLDGHDVRAAARSAWMGARDPDDGCALLGRTLVETGAAGADEVWAAARVAVEMNRPRVARALGALIGPAVAQAMADVVDNPLRYLKRRPPVNTAARRELELLALMRIAATDPDEAAARIDAVGPAPLSAAMTATAWAHAAKQAALKLQPGAADLARRAWQLWDVGARAGTAPPWSDDLLAWHVRAALRQPASDKARWPLALRAIDAMSAAEQRESTWVYWKARALQETARPGPEGEVQRAAAREALESIAGQMSFYGKLATEDLGRRVSLPSPPAPLSAAEREAPRARPGLVRGLQLIALGLRSEGVREWNYTLRGLPERELLAAAQWACESEVWDRCISTSDRTRAEVDVRQRFPMPFREQVLAQAGAAGLDPAVLYGLIRQESRFVLDARSGVGAAGLMQIMPATAKWTAKQVGLSYRPEMLADRELNLQLGAAYLKRVLDDFGGSLALAAAAYNAGPGRPRRWREGGSVMEPAAWAETIPFGETRDYVKKVLSNSVYYAALLGAAAGPGVVATATLKDRLGAPIGPAARNASDRELP